MYLRGRTVALLIVFAVLLSSLTTAAVVGGSDLLSQVTGSNSAVSNANTKGLDENLGKLKQAYGLLKSQYIHNVDDQKLVDGAIRGMVQSIKDPYSSYMDKKTANQFLSSLKSSFQGIGAEVSMKRGRVTIVSPFKNSPAEKAGLQPEDQIIKVNGTSLEGLDLNEAVSKIKGPKGSKAHLEINRPGESRTLKVTVVRDDIPIETVQSKMLDDKVGRIDISQFSEKTPDEFEDQLKSLEKKGMKGLVIDVRGNPGGLLPSVLEISEDLLPKGKGVMMTEDKAGNRTKYVAKDGKKKKYPIVVLTDKGSASASEILIGAMKAAGYPSVGVTSFGKGTVQTTHNFTDGSNMKLTMAKWLTPDGKWIHKKGIKPDVKAKLPAYFKATIINSDKTLKRDQNSTEVKNLQLVLEGLGYRADRKDGYFSSQTETAVKAFQKTHNLPVTGKVDKKTGTKLQEAFIKMLRKPDADLQLRVGLETLKKKIK
ncbi:carboxyl-terminal processing protease [Marininema mesophilum]|uniref:Carboxyl-terminal processing protease n=1 Tax=Marininema mesophilum TaxID=1048340 RepID=A0A1H2TM86_9BACL|nr:S41 family peptidase [Marininema mesophilum]SDW44918.1 carboxyl-terminal processing protease [Marininema mesophilum]